MAVQCVFYTTSLGYGCTIEDQELPSVIIEEYIQGDHEKDKTTDDVEILGVDNSKIEKFPGNIGDVFQHVKILFCWLKNLKSLSKTDLWDFPNLVELNLSSSQLEYLPGDLFEFNVRLEHIYIDAEKIKFIGPELIDGLPNLMKFDLRNIQNMYYEKDNEEFTLSQFKEEIKLKFKPPGLAYEEGPKDMIDHAARLQSDEEKALKSQEESVCGKNLHKELDKFLTLDEFKDFTIKVGSKNVLKNFKVHKLIFMARSQFLVDFIKKNPDADELVLTDISVEVFESILDFVYTDQPPENTKNTREIIAAAGKLKMASLIKIAAENLMNQMEHEENLDLLMENFNLGAKFGLEKLKLKAFEGIKKHFPGKMLKNDLFEDLEKLKKLIEVNKMLEEFFMTENNGN